MGLLDCERRSQPPGTPRWLAGTDLRILTFFSILGPDVAPIRLSYRQCCIVAQLFANDEPTQARLRPLRYSPVLIQTARWVYPLYDLPGFSRSAIPRKQHTFLEMWAGAASVSPHGRASYAWSVCRWEGES